MPRDFLVIESASREAVDAALGRLVRDGTIRRIGRGVYDFPKHSRFGPRAPSPDAVADAIARTTGESICHGDAKAANLLGVSMQVPAQAVYLTTGTNRVVRVDLGDGQGFDIRFMRESPSRMLGANTRAGLVLRALHFLGRDGVNDITRVRGLRAALDEDDLRDLRRLRPEAAGWKRGVIDSILNVNPDNAPSTITKASGATTPNADLA